MRFEISGPRAVQGKGSDISKGKETASGLASRGADGLLAEFATDSVGGQSAFREVVRRYAGAVYATCLRVTKNAHDAEDATQVTFLTLAVQVKGGKPVAKLGPWLQRVAHRAALDLRRGRRRRQAHELRHAESRSRELDALHREQGRNGHSAFLRTSAPNDVEAERLGAVMAEELAKLPARYRLPLASLYCAGMSRAEVAGELGLSLHALRVRVHRGRQMLARRLAARGVGPAGKLLRGGLFAAGLAAVAKRALVARAAEAATAAVPGDLVAATASRVLAAINATVVASLLAKLKGVAGIGLALGVTALAAGAAAAANWSSLEAHLPPVVRQVIDAVTSPWRAPLPRLMTPAPSIPSPVAQSDPSIRRETAIAIPSTALVRLPDEIPPERTRSTRTVSAPAHPLPVKIAEAEPAAPAATSKRGHLQLPARDERPLPVAGPYAIASRGDPSGATFVTRPPNVAHDRGGAATFEPRGASFSVDSLDIGRAGAGRFVQRGGTAFTSGLALGKEREADGNYELVDGALVVRPPGTGAGLRVGGAGTGALHLGGGNSPGGAVFQPRGPARSPDETPQSSLIVRENADGSGLIEGWGGAIGDGGGFVNNGRVVADGAGRDRDLAFLGYGAVTNTIENSPLGGRNGWFARNNGRLALPKLPASAGTGTYTWGEDAADPTLDLVNSVRLTLLDAQNPGKIDLALLDPHRGDVPALPVGHTFIGVWSLDTGLTKPAGGVDLTVRYDDGLAHDLNLDEGVLKLWEYHDGQWIRINDTSFARDLDNHLLFGHADPRVTFIGVSAPEPGATGVMVVCAGFLLARRPRRR